MIKTKFTRITILSLTLSLSGCMGIYEGGFECPPGVGTKCKSISEVNDLVNKGEIPVPKTRIEYAETREGNESSCSCQVEDKPFIKSPEAPQIWWAPSRLEMLSEEELYKGSLSKRNSI